MPADGKPELPGQSKLQEQFGPIYAAVQASPSAVMTIERHVVSGPIPNSQELSALKAVDPAALELVYKLADRQQIHDHAVEIRTLESETSYRRLGMLTALGVIVSMLGTSALALILGYPSAAAWIAGTAGVTSVASVFIRGRNLSLGQPDPTPEAHTGRSQAIPTHAPAPPRPPPVTSR